MDDLIAEALDLHVAAIEDERELDGKYHPSSMWMCARAAILGVRLVPPSSPPDAQAKRVFRIGHLYHALVQDALPGHPKIMAAHPEFKIDVPEWNVVGAGDELILLDNDDWYVVEIKSTKSLKYTPKEDHLKQASVYFMAARDFEVKIGSDKIGWITIGPLGDKLKGIILVYLNKTDLEIKEYVYPYDKKWRSAIEKRVKELDEYRLPDGTNAYPDSLPDPLPLEKGKPNWFTRYCQYRGSGLCCGDTQEDDEW